MEPHSRRRVRGSARAVVQWCVMGLMRRDVLITVGCVLGAALLTLGSYDGDLRQRMILFGGAVVASVAAGLTRSRPVAGVALGTAAAVTDQVIGPSLATALIFTQVLYEAGVEGPPWLPRLLLWAGAMVTVGATVGLLRDRPAQAAANGVLVALLLIVPVTGGMTVRELRRRSEADRRHAEQVARLAAMDDRQAVVAERTRMARELHDVVANHLSVIAIHSTGALALGPDAADGRTRQSLTVIRENAVQGLAELRESIRVLRMGDPGLPGADLGLQHVPAQAERIRRAGLDVRVVTTGTPRGLPIAVDLAAYRIAQECLTNAVKHGGGPVELTIAYGAADVTLTVTNPVAAPVPEPVPGAGAGLVGMRERASLLGGTFAAGATGGVFTVRVRLPVEEDER